MSESDNVEATKKGYAAFAAANLDDAMKVFDDDVEWVQQGRSTVSGTYHGKGEVGDLLAKFAGKTFTTKPKRYVADDDVVIVLTDVTIEGESTEGASRIAEEIRASVLSLRSQQHGVPIFA